MRVTQPAAMSAAPLLFRPLIMTRTDSNKPILQAIILIAVAALVFMLYSLHQLILWRKSQA